MKVSNLSGALLDYWIVRAENYWNGQKTLDGILLNSDGTLCKSTPSFSSNWGLCKNIIERWGHVTFTRFEGLEWCILGIEGVHKGANKKSGETKLIAAMRAYVASQFGEEVSDEVINNNRE